MYVCTSVKMCDSCLFLCFHKAVWRGRSEVGEEEVDPLFWGCHSHHFLCGTQRIRPGAAWGRDHGKKTCSNVCSLSLCLWTSHLSFFLSPYSLMTHLYCKYSNKALKNTVSESIRVVLQCIQGSFMKSGCGTTRQLVPWCILTQTT